MSDDEADPELLELLRQSLGLSLDSTQGPPETRVLESAEYVYSNAIDVAINSANTKAAARSIHAMMQQKSYSTAAWSEHELHPKSKDESTVKFIFTMDLLNFSFWSEKSETERFTVEFRAKKWTGYWSLVAALQRALEEDIPITTSDFWQNEDECTDDVLRHVFRSSTKEEIPLFAERVGCLREAGRILYENYDCSFINCISAAKNSAAALVNLLVNDFPCFRDETRFEGKTVRFYKRAQILVADLWACFDGTSHGTFSDINKITMFADYRIPQMLHTMGCLMYSPPLDSRVRMKKEIESGESWEVQLRGCSIWCIELLRQQILREHPDASANAILIDFFLYDTIKEREAAGDIGDMIPHHRTRSIWY